MIDAERLSSFRDIYVYANNHGEVSVTCFRCEEWRVSIASTTLQDIVRAVVQHQGLGCC